MVQDLLRREAGRRGHAGDSQLDRLDRGRPGDAGDRLRDVRIQADLASDSGVASGADRVGAGVLPFLPQRGGGLAGRPGHDRRARRKSLVADVVVPVHARGDLDRGPVAQRHVAHVAAAGLRCAGDQRRQERRVRASEHPTDAHVDRRRRAAVEIHLDPLTRKRGLLARHPDPVHTTRARLIQHHVPVRPGRQEITQVMIAVRGIERVPVKTRHAPRHRPRLQERQPIKPRARRDAIGRARD